jgi:hypothetical protein
MARRLPAPPRKGRTPCVYFDSAAKVHAPFDARAPIARLSCRRD